MRAKYNPQETEVRLFKDDAILILEALDELRYSDKCAGWDGNKLLNLAVLSHTWRAMVQDMNSPDANERCRKHNNTEALRDIAECAGPREEEQVNGGAY